jgi:putative ABC transport system permease protein
MILLRLLSWQYARKHRARSVLTVLGIALGVGVFVGMHAANQSILAAFGQTVDRIAGSTALQVSAGESGFDEEVLEAVQQLPEVRVAVPIVEAVAATGIRGQGNLLILGVDMVGDRGLRDYSLEGGQQETVEDPLVFLAQPDSLVVSREFAARNGLDLNSRPVMWTMDGPKQFTIRGLMRSGGLASAFGGNLAVMDIYAAQKVFGRGRKFDRIDVAVQEGVTVEQCRTAIERRVGPAFEVRPPAGRSQQFDFMMQGYSTSLNISSAFALFIGLFIISNSFSIAVTQRRSEIGILRALGATRRQIRRLFVGESAVLGLLGSMLGIGLGMLLAGGLMRYINHVMEGAYGVAEQSRDVVWSPVLLLAALGFGAATSLVAAWLPARAAAAVDPVQALQKGKLQVLSAGENRRRRAVAGILLFGCLACLLLGSSRVFFYGGYALLITATVLLTPSLSLWLARWLRPFLKRLRPIEGALAADSLVQAPRRTSATVSALMLCLAMLIGLAGTSRASYGSIEEWLSNTLNSDLFVSASENLVSRNYRFPASMRAQLERIQGVEEVQPVRNLRITFRNSPVLLISVDIVQVAKRTPRRRAIAGSMEEMNRLAGQGKGVIVSENLAQLKNLAMGSEVELAAPSAALRLPVVGIVRDFSDQQGTIFLDQSVYLRAFNDPTFDSFRVYLKPGTRAAEVKSSVLEKFSQERRLFVFLNEELRSYVLRLAGQWFGMTYIQLALALVVGVLGIANTLTVSIADRRRELGILRAVGGLRNVVRRAIALVALAIGVIGLILGLSLGSINLYYQLEMVRRDLTGMPLDYMFPWGVALALLPLVLSAAVASALGPAESAVRGSLVEALAYE